MSKDAQLMEEEKEENRINLTFGEITSPASCCHSWQPHRPSSPRQFTAFLLVLLEVLWDPSGHLGRAGGEGEVAPTHSLLVNVGFRKKTLG